MTLTNEKRTALVLRLQQHRIARGWAGEVRDAAPQTELDDLLAAAAAASVSARLSGPARAAAAAALEVLSAFRDEPTMPALPKLEAKYEPTERELRKARAERKRREREEREQARARAKHAELIEAVDELRLAHALMSSGVEVDDYSRLAIQHIEHGFALPPAVAEAMARRLAAGELANTRDDDHVLRFTLLQTVCSRLRGPSKTLAHSYCDWWETSGKMRWSRAQLATIENLLGEARNDGRVR